jgi:hypothetical protein
MQQMLDTESYRHPAQELEQLPQQIILSKQDALIKAIIKYAYVCEAVFSELSINEDTAATNETETVTLLDVREELVKALKQAGA